LRYSFHELFDLALAVACGVIIVASVLYLLLCLWFCCADQALPAYNNRTLSRHQLPPNQTANHSQLSMVHWMMP